MVTKTILINCTISNNVLILIVTSASFVSLSSDAERVCLSFDDHASKRGKPDNKHNQFTKKPQE